MANRFDQPVNAVQFRDRGSTFVPEVFVPSEVPEQYVGLPTQELGNTLKQIQGEFEGGIQYGDKAEEALGTAASEVPDTYLSAINKGEQALANPFKTQAAQLTEQFTERKQELQEKARQGDRSALTKLRQLGREYGSKLNPLVKASKDISVLEEKIAEAETKGQPWQVASYYEQINNITEGKPYSTDVQANEYLDVDKRLDAVLDNLVPQKFSRELINRGGKDYFISKDGSEVLAADRIMKAAQAQLQNDPDFQDYFRNMERMEKLQFKQLRNQGLEDEEIIEMAGVPEKFIKEDGTLDDDAYAKAKVERHKQGLINVQGFTRQVNNRNSGISNVKWDGALASRKAAREEQQQSGLKIEGSMVPTPVQQAVKMNPDGSIELDKKGYEKLSPGHKKNVRDFINNISTKTLQNSPQMKKILQNNLSPELIKGLREQIINNTSNRFGNVRDLFLDKNQRAELTAYERQKEELENAINSGKLEPEQQEKYETMLKEHNNSFPITKDFISKSILNAATNEYFKEGKITKEGLMSSLGGGDFVEVEKERNELQARINASQKMRGGKIPSLLLEKYEKVNEKYKAFKENPVVKSISDKADALVPMLNSTMEGAAAEARETFGAIQNTESLYPMGTDMAAISYNLMATGNFNIYDEDGNKVNIKNFRKLGVSSRSKIASTHGVIIENNPDDPNKTGVPVKVTFETKGGNSGTYTIYPTDKEYLNSVRDQMGLTENEYNISVLDAMAKTSGAADNHYNFRAVSMTDKPNIVYENAGVTQQGVTIPQELEFTAENVSKGANLIIPSGSTAQKVLEMTIEKTGATPIRSNNGYIVPKDVSNLFAGTMFKLLEK